MEPSKAQGKRTFNFKIEEEEEAEEDQDEDHASRSSVVVHGEDDRRNRVMLMNSTTTSATAPSKKGSGAGGSTTPGPCCQAQSCNADLTDAKQYYRRHKVCDFHSKDPAVVVAGMQQRFCQQCSRFHNLSEFDENKRSCRRRLAGHNERRRKSSSDYPNLITQPRRIEWITGGIIILQEGGIQKNILTISYKWFFSKRIN